jgi:AcrR family transcriptional regulator
MTALNTSSPRRSAAGSKNHIAQTALDLFIEQGYDNVTVEDVAAAAGVSRRTVFRHFPSKEELPFPDHAERRRRAEEMLNEPGRGADPVQDVIDATEFVLADFLATPDLVLRRYALTRLVPELAEREILEHEKYLRHTRRHLRVHLPTNRHPFEPMAIAHLIDAMHRTAFRDWLRSGGTTDALADLRAGTDWALRALASVNDDAQATSLIAVVPNTARARQLAQELAALSQGPFNAANP